MDLEIVILSEISQTEKDKYHISHISLICEILKKKIVQTYNLLKKTEIESKI